jgi:hypothetical protein
MYYNSIWTTRQPVMTGLIVVFLPQSTTCLNALQQAIYSPGTLD